MQYDKKIDKMEVIPFLLKTWLHISEFSLLIPKMALYFEEKKLASYSLVLTIKSKAEGKFFDQWSVKYYQFIGFQCIEGRTWKNRGKIHNK